MTGAPQIVECEPHQLGWLRRTDLEKTKGQEVWEQPDGKLLLHDRRFKPALKIVKFMGNPWAPQ